jgi:hypothetical protein
MPGRHQLGWLGCPMAAIHLCLIEYMPISLTLTLKYWPSFSHPACCIQVANTLAESSLVFSRIGRPDHTVPLASTMHLPSKVP